MADAGKGGDNSEFTLLLLLGMIFGLGWVLWAGLKPVMVEGIRYVKGAELFVFQFVDKELAQDRETLWGLKNDQAAIKQISANAEKQKKEISAPMWAAGGYLAPSVLWEISNHVGEYTRWIAAAFLAAAGYFYMNISKKTQFRTVWNLESLIRKQSSQWPVITPIVDFNPSDANARNLGDKVPETLPLFAEALAPEEWVAYHGIKIENKMPDKEMLHHAFAQQLGPRWHGLASLQTPAQRCLFAAFALKGAQKRKESDALLGKIATFWNHKTDFNPSAELLKEVDDLIKDPKIGGEALRVADRYAYRTTALLAVLKWARERGGVLASAAFLWLRGHDRGLWYPLNNLGRRTYHAEAAGAMAHYMMERETGRPLPIPRLETAIVTLIQYWGKVSPKLPEIEKASKKG